MCFSVKQNTVSPTTCRQQGYANSANMADAAGVTPAPGEVTKAFLAGAMLVFGGILVVGFAYEWRKGVFKWS